MYVLLGISLVLAILLIVNVAVALAASIVWWAISDLVEAVSVRTRAKIIFGLRIIPVVAAITFILAFMVPAYILHEPENSGEVVTAKLALIALLSAAGVALALFRVFQAWSSTRSLMQNWLDSSTRIHIDGVELPIHRIEHQFPVLAVVGVFRPRIFVAENVLATLSDHELRVSIAHELGHLHGRDNLKRTLMHFCRDLVILPIGTHLDRAWAQNAEAVADEFAVAERGGNGLDLASALVKITRIVPKGYTPALPVGAHFVTDRKGDIASRVRRLLKFSDGPSVATGRRRVLAMPSYVWSLGVVLLLTLHFADQRLLWTTHQAIEHFVRMTE